MQIFVRRLRKPQRKVSPYVYFSLLCATVVLLCGHSLLNTELSAQHQGNSKVRLKNIGHHGIKLGVEGLNDMYQGNVRHGAEESVYTYQGPLPGLDKNESKYQGNNSTLEREQTEYQANSIIATKQSEQQEHSRLMDGAEPTGPRINSVRDTEINTEHHKRNSSHDEEDRGRNGNPVVSRQDQGEVVQPGDGRISEGSKGETIDTHPQLDTRNIITGTSTHLPLHRPQTSGPFYCTVSCSVFNSYVCVCVCVFRTASSASRVQFTYTHV